MPPRENILTLAGLAAGFFVLLWLVGCTPAEADTHAAQQARQELLRDLAAQQACPPGYAVIWLGASEMQCNKEITP